MSDWHDEFTEPMHDTPADKDPLIAAMEAAGYTYDGLESTNDYLRFFGEGGQVITMGGWHECEEWLNGVVFDDPQVMDRVEIILHPLLLERTMLGILVQKSYPQLRLDRLNHSFRRS